MVHGRRFPHFLRAESSVRKISPLRLVHRLTAVLNQDDLACVVSAGSGNFGFTAVPVIYENASMSHRGKVRGPLACTAALPSPYSSPAFNLPPHRRRVSDGRLARKLDFGQDHGARGCYLKLLVRDFQPLDPRRIEKLCGKGMLRCNR